MNESEQRREASKHEDEVVDRISNMPDAILLLILSRLKSTEETIRSSILSKRWRYLWTAIPSLDLHYMYRHYSRIYGKRKFKEFVDWVLLNRSADLDCFRLTCLDYYSMWTVEQWIHTVVMRNIKQLDLLFRPEDDNEDIEMPHCLVTCGSLEVLKLSSYALLILPSFPGFPALRALKLDDVMLFDDDLVNYFFEKSCPLLEDLTFERCTLDKHDLLCISCPNLKKLRFWNLDLSCLKLSCPKLMRLVLNGKKLFPKNKKSGDIHMMMPHCLATCASSLEVLKLKLHGHRLIWPSFFGFPALRILKLVDVELFDDDLVNRFLESCPLLEDLTFQDCIDKLDLLCISCPNLKKLTIYKLYMDDEELCGSLKLSCPKLVCLKLTGYVASNYIVERLYSLKEAATYTYANTIHRLLPGISHVESLRIDLQDFYEYIYDACDPGHPPLPNLKNLELTTKNATYTFKALIQVLKYCLKLESLSLTVDNVCSYGSEDYDEMEFPQLDEAETRWILTPEVKGMELFKFNGEKPKLDLGWLGNENKSEWTYVIARWGNKVRYSH